MIRLSTKDFGYNPETKLLNTKNLSKYIKIIVTCRYIKSFVY